MENSKKYTVITVGRQFGSGGRELGRRLAEALGFEFYDKKLLPEAAGHMGEPVPVDAKEPVRHRCPA